MESDKEEKEEEEIVYRRRFNVYSDSSDADDNNNNEEKEEEEDAESPKKKAKLEPAAAANIDLNNGINGRRLTSNTNHNPPAGAMEKPIQLAIFRQESIAREKDGNERPTMVSVQFCQLLKTQQRNTLVTDRDPLGSFNSNVDHYASLHPDAVWGVKLLDLAKAFFPSGVLHTTLVNVNSEPTVTGVPAKFFQTVMYVANTLFIQTDQVYPLLSSAYLPRAPSANKNPDWRSETHDTNRFDPAKRRFPKERVIPVYLIPHFFALHPALKNSAHNNAILFGHRLIREMERRVTIKYNNACFMDSMQQLCANFDKLAYYFQTHTEMLHGLLSKMDGMACMHEETRARLDRMEQLQKLSASRLEAAPKEEKEEATNVPVAPRPSSRKRKRTSQKRTEVVLTDPGGDLTLAPVDIPLENVDDIVLDELPAADANDSDINLDDV